MADAAGRPVAVQLSDVELWPDKTVKKARLSLMVTLKPDEAATWTLTAGPKAVKQPPTDLAAAAGWGRIELATAKTGIRLAEGRKTFAGGAAAEKTPAPIQGVRLPDGQWIGKGWWQTDVRCTEYSAEITEKGPVFARAKLRYEFEGGTFYAATVELNAGQDLAVIREEYGLSEGKSYAMLGVAGMKGDTQYKYVYPQFAPPDRALLWDWWGQIHAVLPTPNAYGFSFGELKPDSAEFAGRRQYGHLKEGDGGLVLDKDGRFAYLNAYLQWGDEETLYLGLYSSKSPSRVLGVAALRPSEWLHPDIAPHPDATLKQYTRTTCLTFERRTTGDVFFRAPVCLGKRVYGIGGMERTRGRHILSDRGGPKMSDQDVWGSELALRHVRLGRLPLDTVKDGVLAWDEAAKYPRLYVPEGDRARYESRRMRKPLDEVKKELDARQGPTEAEKATAAGACTRSGPRR